LADSMSTSIPVYPVHTVVSLNVDAIQALVYS